MKHPLLVAPLLLAACGGGELALSITSDDLGDNSQRLATSADLTTVKSLRLTVDEVWVHVSGTDTPHELRGEDIPDTGDGWHLLTTVDQSFDLMTVRGGATRLLGGFPVPEGHLTQVRLKLKPEMALTGERGRLAGAVVEQDGTACNLSLPASVFEPGLKLSGVLTPLRLEAGGTRRALINLKIKDSTKLDGDTCVYKLDPVLKVRWLQPVSGVGGD
ncbi:DUF4382 domain-containing protein [Pyxidicoccus sp. 3LFB2]